jgi:hypothetical protein
MGTLQPLFINLRNGHDRVMSDVFSQANYTSLIGMLKKWEISPAGRGEEFNEILAVHGFSPLDDLDLIAGELGMDRDKLQEMADLAADRNSASVNWAIANVLEGRKIKVDWAAQLRSASSSAEYRSIQIEKAEELHEKAMDLYDYFNMSQLRAYLFFFDIIVQNGGINDAVKAKYDRFIKANPNTSEVNRLKKILQLRLPYVRAKYRNDVQSRKLSIINGTGKVHGKVRNYKNEYCADVGERLP